VNAAEVLDHKADLMARLNDPHVYASWREQVALDIRWEDSTGPVPITPAREQQNRSNAAAIITTLKSDLPEAEAYHVSRDMVTVIQYAATQLDETDRFNRMILPSRSGIARFDGGIPWTDVRGKKMRLSWVVWGPILGQYQRPRHDAGEPMEFTQFWMFNDHFDEPDQVAEEMFAEFRARDGEEFARRVWGRWGFMGGEYLTEGQRLGPAMRVPDDAKMAEVLADGDTPTAYTNPTRLMQAFWMLLGQTITVTSDAHLDRARRKRAGKAKIPDRVTVVQLRRTEGQRRSDGETLVEWSHRWLVKGYWNWYHCGPDHPQAQEVEPGKFMCRLWIAPQVRGPKDKPLVVTDKIYALHR
jgi:hypothetical protein